MLHETTFNSFGFLLANFQNGIFKRVDSVKVKRVENESCESKFALVATSDSVYKADITNPGSASVNTFLAIRNKRTNEMKLVQVQEASFKHTLYDSKNSIFQNNVVDAKKVLLKEFGGKKAQASYERSKKSVPNIQVLEDALDQQLNAIDDNMFEKDIFDQSQQERECFQNTIFPEIDTSSGSGVRDVFTAKKLLGENILDHLCDVAIQVLQTDPEEIDFANKYLSSTVKSIQIKKQPDTAENVERVAMLIYIDALIRVINCRRKSLENCELSRMSDRLQREVRKKFSVQGNFSNSKFTRQKSIIFYLILLLISSENLEVELDHCLDGVTVNKTELLKYAIIIGAKVKNKTTLYIQQAKLNTDSKLSAPMPSGKRRRKN